MQPVINAPEIATAREQQLFNGKNFHVFIYNKTESISGQHQHDYYEFTLVLTGRYSRRLTVSACYWNGVILFLFR
ncbi:chb operon repressor [Escherichia coli]|uniref:Chb operon repressor n=1 Tax=Escherichia coli TaxID=562 RepID=A0A377BL82_ECOLX|nr:chb operon repressor [Escherichia coli]